MFEVIYIYVKNEYGFFFTFLSFINMQSRIIGYEYKINSLRYPLYESKLLISSSQNAIAKKQFNDINCFYQLQIIKMYNYNEKKILYIISSLTLILYSKVSSIL